MGPSVSKVTSSSRRSCSVIGEPSSYLASPSIAAISVPSRRRLVSVWVATEGVEGFGDPRYLLPLMGLLGGAVTLAVRGVGRRWAPAVGALILVLFLAHDLFS